VGVDAWLRGDNAEAMRVQRAALLMKRPLVDYIGIAECLEAVAWIETSEHRYVRAATLFGASDTTWTEVGMALSALPGLHRHREVCGRQAQSIGKRAFDAAYREGARMSLEQAITFALDETPKSAPTSGAGPVALTKRETEIAQMIGEGMSNGDIAKTLVVSRRTVEAHVQHLMAKLDFSSRTQVAAWVAAGAGNRRSPTV
jgi:DNA-binding NarL/FixJ family response regulator